jgi:hypothetical protein
MKRLSPLRSIRLHCLYCMGGAYSLVRDCEDAGCPLHPFRMGKLPVDAARRPLRAIRSFCVTQCLAGSTAEVRTCSGNIKVPGNPGCPLCPFRFGVRPETLLKRNLRQAQLPGVRPRVAQEQKMRRQEGNSAVVCG